MKEFIVKRSEWGVTEVRGTPKGQPRPRAFSRGGKAAVYDPGTAEGWKSCVAVAVREWADAKLEGALSVTLTFFMPRPKKHFTTSGQLKAGAPCYLYANKPDADNLAKAVLDALTALRVWGDDDQVVELIVRKYWESDRNGKQANPPGCIIRITTLTEEEA